MYAHSLGLKFCTKIVTNESFFYLSPLFSVCKLTQNSPLGELIKLLYCIVLYGSGNKRLKRPFA